MRENQDGRTVVKVYRTSCKNVSRSRFFGRDRGDIFLIFSCLLGRHQLRGGDSKRISRYHAMSFERHDTLFFKLLFKVVCYKSGYGYYFLSHALCKNVPGFAFNIFRWKITVIHSKVFVFNLTEVRAKWLTNFQMSKV